MKNYLLIIAALIVGSALLPSCSGNQDYSGGYEGNRKESVTDASPGLAGNANYSATNEESPLEMIRFSPPEPADNVLQATTGPIPVVVNTREKKIIKNANVKFQVKDLKKSTAAVEAIVKKYNSYITVANEGTNYNGIFQTMTIRIPAAGFDAFVADMMKESIYLEFKNISSEDVTSQFVDTEARLKTKKEIEQRYKEILKQAKTIEEILRVESQLGAIREEIEAKEGTLKFLSDQVSYSTVQLEMYEQISGQVQPEYGFFSRLGQAIGDGWTGLLGFLIGIFRAWPLWIILGGVYYVVRKWWKRRKNRSGK